MKRSNSQSYFFVQAAFWASVSGECPADQKDVARSRPPWQGVQPKELAGCIDSLPTMRWIRGCVRKTSRIFGSSKPFRSAATWQVVQRSTRGICMKLTLMKWSGSWTCCTRRDGLIMSRIGELRRLKSVSCLRPAYFWRVMRKSADFFSSVFSMSFLRVLMRSISACAAVSSLFSFASRTVRSSSCLRRASRSFLADDAAFGRFARASSYL